MEEEIINTHLIVFKYCFFKTLFHIYFLNVDIAIVPVWISMKSLPLIENIHMEGMVSQIFDVGSSFDFITKNGKLVIILFFLAFIVHFIK